MCPLTDVALAAAGVAGEKRRSVEDDAYAAAAFLGPAHLRKHVLEEKERAVIDARQSRPEASIIAQSVVLLLDEARLLLPLHSKGRVSQHVVEGQLLPVFVAIESVLRETVAEHDVVGVLAFDEHVRFTHGPGFVVPVLSEQKRVGFRIQVADIFLRYREHSASAAGGIENGLYNMATPQVFLRREQQVYHQLDHFAWREVLAGFLVRLLGADPNKFLEHIAHLNVVHTLRREIDLRECLDDFIKQILLRHPRYLLIEGESIHDVAHVFGEPADIAVKVRRKLVGIIQQLGHVELGKIVKWATGNLLKQTPHHCVRPGFNLRVFRQHLGLRWRQKAIEAPEHC